MATQTYSIRNWAKYNKDLMTRGDITLWINEKSIKNWYEDKAGPQEPGRPRRYSDMAIELCLIVRSLFNLPYRQSEGFLNGLFKLIGFKQSVPSYTQMCRRQKTLCVKLAHQVKGRIHVVVDGTGLKIFGEGEWKVRQHGYIKHRMWRKWHIGIDVKSKAVVMQKLTDNHVGENTLLADLLKQYKGKLTKVGGDKGYDSYVCHETVRQSGAQSAILPQRKAKIRKRLKTGEPTLARDDIIRRINAVGRKKWKQEVGYHQRSLVENTFYRFKTIFGPTLRSRCLENQQVEALIKCNLLNAFTHMGMPISVPCDG